MMKRRKPYRSGLVLALLILGTAALLAACASGGDDGTQTTLSVVMAQPTLSPTSSSLANGSEVDALSTFRSKDPFIQQALPVATTATTGPTGTTTPTPGGSTSTSIFTTTSFFITTSTAHTTTTAPATTTTTVAHLHSLKILSIATISGAPVVTFKVDSTTYKDKRKGDVVSSTWGQIEVAEINTSSKVVTLLQGSETLILSVGQSTFE